MWLMLNRRPTMMASPGFRLMGLCLVAFWGTAFARKAGMLKFEMPPEGTIVTLSESEVASFVNQHNTYRASVGASNMLKMSWDYDMAAQSEVLGRTCNFDHAFQTLSDGRFVGQNIFYQSSGWYSNEGGMKYWWDEKANYNENTWSCTPNTVCGHYTQMAWAATSSIGCSVTQCDIISEESMGISVKERDVKFLVCNYYSSGNYGGQNPYKLGSACSNCPAGASCDGGLCVTSATIPAPAPSPSQPGPGPYPGPNPGPNPGPPGGSGNQNSDCAMACQLCGGMADISRCNCACPSRSGYSTDCMCTCPFGAVTYRKSTSEYPSDLEVSAKSNSLSMGCAVGAVQSLDESNSVTDHDDDKKEVRGPDVHHHQTWKKKKNTWKKKKNKGKHGNKKTN